MPGTRSLAIQLIDVLEHRGDHASKAWAEALRQLILLAEDDAPPRSDLLVYVCGRKPVRSDDWLPTDAPAPEYTGGRPLEAVEVHLDQLDGVLKAVFPAHTVDRA